MSSLIKKLLYSLMIILGFILIATTNVKAEEIASFPRAYDDLKISNTFYCMEHQKWFDSGDYHVISTHVIRSDDPEQDNRTLAKILYDGILSGQGGYHEVDGGPYQHAVWKWCFNQGISGIPVESSIYDQAYAAVKDPLPYSEAGQASISLVDNKMTMNGMVGSIKIKSINGSVNGIDIVWKDIVSNDDKNNQTKTIDANSSSIPGWIELYRDKNCTQLINVSEIKQNDTIYFKNLQPNYWIKTVTINVKAKSTGYTVTWKRWRRTDNKTSDQDLMSATKSEGVETNANVSISTDYSYGRIKIKKVGLYTKDGKENPTSNIKATFKLYCTTLNKWVSGTANGRKTYVDDFNKASEYTSKVTVKQLHSTYQYQLVEVKVDNKDYNPIKMVSVGSNLQKDLKVVKNGEYYSTSDVIVYAGKTNEVTVRDEKTSYDLIINKFEKNNASIKIKGVSFLIYGANNGWVKGKDGKYTYSKEIDKINDYKYTTDENGQIKLPSLKKDTYYVYEISAPKNYALKEQKGYMKDPKEHIASLNNKVSEWAYCGNTKLTENVTFDIENERTTVDLTFIKKDEDTREPIQGVSIKVYSNSKGWLIKQKNGEYEFNKDIQPKDVKAFVTDKNGEVKLANLELGTYKLYETKTVDGYNITKQDGYMTDEISKANEWVYLDEVNLNGKNKDNSYEYTLTKTNVKTVNINGHVWLDVNPYKVAEEKNEYNYIYDFEDDKKEWKNSERKDGIAQRDELLSGITVRLLSLDKNEKLCDDTETDDNGFYEFKNINYKDAQNAYVEFVYDNEKYIVVDTLVGEDNRINSKAKEYTMTTDKLDDQKIVDEKIEGSAVTEKKADALMLTYDAKNYAINDVNLGLIPKNTPGMNVYEKLEYIKVALNGFTYTYKYDDPPITADPYAPKANSAESFMAISPTDIAYNKANDGGKLEIYVVYKIDVKNTVTTDKDDIYKEKKLYLSELTNTFDTEWYEKSDEDMGDNEQNEQFKLWTGEGDTLKYNLKAENSAFKEGIKPQETKTSYIQFKVKDDSLNRLLAEGKIKGKATTSYGKGYHEYLRTDNVWVDNKNVTAFKGVQGDYSKETKNEAGEKYYVHRSINVDSTSGDWAIQFELKESRTLSGTVFEDNPVEKDVYVGDGILDDSENVRGKDVKVELLDNKKDIASLYPVKKEQVNENQVKYTVEEPTRATTMTANDGTYKFDGVVPGYYYIRFTYGNGDQKMVDTNGNEIDITARDYKSTIVVDRERLNDDDELITEEVVAAADKAYNEAQKNGTLEEYKKTKSEWYTSFKYEYKGKEYSVEYSTAVDDLTARHGLDDYTFTDGIAYDKDGNPDDKYGKTLIPAYTPLFGIKIENTKGLEGLSSEIFSEGKNPKEFNGFNFGLIKQQNTTLIPDKKITNVKFTDQVGTTLVSDNPADSKSVLLTALDEIKNKAGSKYAKLELEPDLIYGSTVEVTYSVDIENDSKIEYATDDFYKYGTQGGDEDLKKIEVKEVEDKIDEKFDFNSAKTISSTSGQTEVKPTTETIENETGTITKKYWSIVGWEKIASQQTASVSYTATVLIGNTDDDTEYTNKAKVKTISLDKFTSLNTESSNNWEDDGTEFTIVSNTGENRSTTYYIIGAAALVLLVGGIVLIKKKVM